MLRKTGLQTGSFSMFECQRDRIIFALFEH